MDEIKPSFEHLRNEVAQISYKWELYKSIYNEESIDLLNKTSAVVFSELQSLLFQSMILSISKLYDSKEIAGNKNLSLKYLSSLADKYCDEAFSNDLNSSINETKKSIDKIIKARHKRIAHLDLDTALCKTVTKTSIVTKNDINYALTQTYEIMNKIDRKLFDNTTFYGDIIMPIESGAGELLRWLKKGVAYDRMEKEGLIESGRWKETERSG